jgi:hypothetical protein
MISPKRCGRDRGVVNFMMSKRLSIIILLVSISIIYLLQPDAETATVGTRLAPQHGLPWQIELSAGNSRVFGISPGVSTVAEVIASIDFDYELAILATYQQSDALELFYRHFKAGLLQGQLIVVIDIDAVELEHLKKQAARADMLDNGTQKYQLSERQFHRVQTSLVRSITFVPAINLDKAVIEQHFGKVASIMAVSEGQTHYFYPELGLDILINDRGKDFLQYVAPKQFAALQQSIQLQTELIKKR